MINTSCARRHSGMTIWLLMLLLAAIAMLIAIVPPTIEYFQQYHNRPLPGSVAPAKLTPMPEPAPAPATTTVPAAPAAEPTTAP